MLEIEQTGGAVGIQGEQTGTEVAVVARHCGIHQAVCHRVAQMPMAAYGRASGSVMT